MKATLTFDLPDEQDDFDNATNGAKWRVAMWDFRQALRQKYKHGGQETFTTEELLDMIREAHEAHDLQLE